MFGGSIGNLVLRTNGEKKNQICQGSLVVFELPFRISSGRITHFKDKFEGHSAESWLLNKIPSYSYRNFNEPYHAIPPQKDLVTRFATFVKAKQFDDNLLRNAALAWENKQDVTFPKIDLEYAAMRILERFVIALRANCTNCISSPIGDLYQGTIWEMLRWRYLEFNVIVFGSSPIPDDIIWALSFGERHMNVGSGWSGILKDISESEKDAIQSFLNEKLDNNLFYELRYRALQMEKSGDWRSALLWDIIALETLVNLFYDYWLDDFSNARQAKSSDGHALWSIVSRDIGLTNLVQLIPHLINSDAQCPSEEVTRKVVAAIKIRNKLTHALKTKDGEYHIRIIDNAKLVAARKSVSEFSELLLSIMENRYRHRQ